MKENPTFQRLALGSVSIMTSKFERVPDNCSLSNELFCESFAVGLLISQSHIVLVRFLM